MLPQCARGGPGLPLALQAPRLALQGPRRAGLQLPRGIVALDATGLIDVEQPRVAINVLATFAGHPRPSELAGH
eukprot:2100328-Pyramimonas_sp.AAC.1